MTRIPQAIFVALAAAVLLASGCGRVRPVDLCDRFQHEDPAVRTAAALEVGRTGNREGLSYLVDRLTDPEPEVRFAAIMALRRITGQTMGYRYHDRPAAQADAVARWRQWLRSTRGGVPASRPASRPAPGKGA
jgi:hypothetical protein